MRRAQRKKSSITIEDIVDKTGDLEEEDDMITLN